MVSQCCCHMLSPRYLLRCSQLYLAVPLQSFTLQIAQRCLKAHADIWGEQAEAVNSGRLRRTPGDLSGARSTCCTVGSTHRAVAFGSSFCHLFPQSKKTGGCQAVPQGFKSHAVFEAIHQDMQDGQEEQQVEVAPYASHRKG